MSVDLDESVTLCYVFRIKQECESDSLDHEY